MNVGSCSQPWFEMQIQYDTQVRPCCYFAEVLPAWDFSQPVDLQTLWNGSNFIRIRAIIASNADTAPPCAACQFIRYATEPQFLEIDPAANELQRENWVAALQNYQSRELVVRSTPVRFYFNFGLACNLSCIMCCQMDERIKDSKTISTERLLELKEYLVRANEIVVIGGEPFLLPQARSFINAIAADPDYSNVKLTICTNAVLLDRFMPQLRSMRRLNILVSLDSVGDTYEHIRKGASWEQTSRNILNFKKESLSHNGLWNIAVSGIIMKSSIPRLADFANWCVSHDIPVHFVPLVEYQFTETENIFKHPELLNELQNWECQFDEAIVLLENKCWFEKGSRPLKLMKQQLQNSWNKKNRQTSKSVQAAQNWELKKTSTKPYLSIVVAARNDNHGGSMLKRMQIFTNGILAQTEKFKLPCELIVVEWNPPADKPPLGEALTWPKQSEYCDVRFIVFPRELHDRYKHAAQLPLYQMIAKNVGIRRARGEFVIATNIDILFSDELFAFMASRQLDPQRMYRCQRHDVNEDIPLELSQSEHLEYCRNNIVRINSRYGSEDLITGDIVSFHKADDEIVNGVANLNTNACGDFTMLSREAWFRLNGYPEFDMYSFHLDSLLCYMAFYAGYREVDLAPPLLTYHIEHGGGFKPKDSSLDNYLARKKILKMSDGELLYYVKYMHEQNQPILFNDESWGEVESELPEYYPVVGSGSKAGNYGSVNKIINSAASSCAFVVRLVEGAEVDWVRQTNGLRSLRMFFPFNRLLVFGCNERSAAVAVQFDAEFRMLDAGPFGEPRVADVLRTVLDISNNQMVVWLEPGIILTENFKKGIFSLQDVSPPFVATGRSNLFFASCELSFCHPVLARILEKNALETNFLTSGADPGYFVFNNCRHPDYVPPFTFSTPDWKKWLLGYAQEAGARLIDMTPAITVPCPMIVRNKAADAAFNRLLANGKGCTLAAAQFCLTGQGIIAADGAAVIPENTPQDHYRLFFHMLEDARSQGDVFEGVRIADYMETYFQQMPHALYALYVQRGKLHVLARDYKRAIADFLAAIRIDPDIKLPAPGLYCSMRFALITDQKFLSCRYELELSEANPTIDPHSVKRHAELRVKAQRHFSENHFFQTIAELQEILQIDAKTIGANLGIAICLALTERVHEAVHYAEIELSLPRPHPDAGLLLSALQKSLTIPATIEQAGSESFV